MTDNSAVDQPGSLPRWQAVAEIALIVGVFFVHAGWPVPDVNEAHYLTKAKHFWDADWIAGDFFLESADAHLVFYYACGWLTRLMSLPAFAWTGRLLVWGLSAWAWQRLSFAVVPRKLCSVLSAALFVTLCEYGHLAGEWVIGGFEAKGFSYALVFLALERMIRNRWNVALLLLGAATAFHALVGGWTAVACGVAWLAWGRSGAPVKRIWPGLLGAALLAVAGVLPALALSWGTKESVVAHANNIYVFQRLRHHLDPRVFGPLMVARHAGLLAAWLFLWLAARRRRGDEDSKETLPAEPLRRLAPVVLAAVGLAVAGFAIGYLCYRDPDLNAALLRYYWFRLSDALLPLGVALACSWWIARLLAAAPRAGALALLAALLVAGAHLGHVLLLRRELTRPRADRPDRVLDYADWRDVCRAVRLDERFEPGAAFLTPRLAQTFKWYTGRREVASWKDIPQDAPSIKEWWERMKEIYKVDRRHPPASLAAQGSEELERLGKLYHARYIVTAAEPPLRLKLVYANRSYAVYEVPLDEEEEKGEE